ncbi:hypothetical protein NFI96_027364, partial [Prochilodus magdalenae]
SSNLMSPGELLTGEPAETTCAKDPTPQRPQQLQASGTHITSDEEPGETASCPPLPPAESSNGPTSDPLASEWRTPSSTFYTDLSLTWRTLGALLALCKPRNKTCENLGSVLKLETYSLKELELSKNDLQDSGVHFL